MAKVDKTDLEQVQEDILSSLKGSELILVRDAIMPLFEAHRVEIDEQIEEIASAQELAALAAQGMDQSVAWATIFSALGKHAGVLDTAGVPNASCPSELKEMIVKILANQAAYGAAYDAHFNPPDDGEE